MGYSTLQHRCTCILKCHSCILFQVALLHPKRRLQPRTYRVAAGNTLLVGGVARIDVLDTPGATIYLTVFASSAIACHMSKTDNVSERCAPHSAYRSHHAEPQSCMCHSRLPWLSVRHIPAVISHQACRLRSIRAIISSQEGAIILMQSNQHM